MEPSLDADDAAESPPSTMRVVARALRLAREVEELLEDAGGVASAGRSGRSTRMASALAASLIDELEALARSEGAAFPRKNGAA